MSNNQPVQDRRTLDTPTIIGVLILCFWAIAQISTGAVYLHDCPRQHYIPIYLIVLGVFGLLLSCVFGKEKKGNGTLCAASLISMFLFCWFIAGNVWIYSIYQPNYNKNTGHPITYCNKTLYLFAFWTTTLVNSLVGAIIVCWCCCCCCCFFEPSQSNTIDNV